MGSNASIPGLNCPSCAESGSLQLRLEDGIVVCHDCEEEFNRARIEQTVASWTRLLTWLKNDSTRDDELA